MLSLFLLRFTRFTDYRKIGIGLSTGGLLFTVLGVFMFFDRGLLAMGNILFLMGVMLIIGPKRTGRFFFQWRKAKGTACFMGGMALVLYGYAMIGILIEGWGFLNLFGDFFPTALCVDALSSPLHALFLLLAFSLFHHGIKSDVYVSCFIFRSYRRGFLRNFPIIGDFLSWRPVRMLTDRFISKSRLPV